MGHLGDHGGAEQLSRATRKKVNIKVCSSFIFNNNYRYTQFVFVAVSSSFIKLFFYFQ